MPRSPASPPAALPDTAFLLEGMNVNKRPLATRIMRSPRFQVLVKVAREMKSNVTIPARSRLVERGRRRARNGAA